jgi:hypothetical protein
MNVILDIRNLTRTHGQGEQAVHASAAWTWRSPPAGSSR